MKKVLLALVFIICASAFYAQSTTDTISDGTNNSSNSSAMPGLYGRHFSACLYTADELNSHAGTLMSISYHIYMGNTAYWDGQQVKIYLKETSATTVDETLTWTDVKDGATMVYDSTSFDLQYDDYWKNFVFTEGFTYNGGNILVIVEGYSANMEGGDEIEIYTNYDNSDKCFIYMCDNVEPDENIALSTMSDDSGEIERNERPDIFFTYDDNAVSACVKTLPYTEDFEGLTAYSNESFPECWGKIFSYQGTLAYDCPSIASTGANSSSGSLFFMLQGDASQFAISPKIDPTVDIRNTTVKFKYKSTKTTEVGIILGVMTDPTDTLTIVPVDTIHRIGSTNTWEQKEINMAAYTGEGHYLVLWFCGRACTAAYPSCFVDDFTVEMSASCTAPVQISANVSDNQATISWTPTDNTTAVRLYYKESTADDYQNVEIAAGTNQYTIENLNYETTYNYYLVTVCGDDESAASETASFSIEAQCPTPEDIAVVVNNDEATISWTDNNSTVRLYYKESTADDFQNVDIEAGTAQYTLQGLTLGATYNYYLVTICDGTESEASETASFTTVNADACIKTLPYTEDFEGLETYSNESFPECWSKIFSYHGTLAYDCPSISPTGADESAGSLFFMLQGDASQFAISPKIDTTVDIRNTTVKFRYKSNKTTETGIILGVMTDPTDTLTIVPMDTIHRIGETSTWELKEINMAAYTGDGHYLVLWFCGRACSAAYPSCFVDNFTVEMSASCTAPVQVSASVNNDEATISWTPTDNTTAVRLYYKASEDTEFQSEEIAAGTNQYTLEGLSLGTMYEYYLVTICGDEESAPTATENFSTPCEEITTFPWTEDFENGLICWTLDASANDQNWVVSTNPSNPSCTPTSGSQVVSFNAYNFYDAWATMTSPAIDLTESRMLTLNMYLYGPQINTYNGDEPYDDKIEIYVNDQPTATDATLIATVTGYSEAEGWAELSFEIPAQTSSRSYITIKGISDFGYNLHIDDLTIENITETEVNRTTEISVAPNPAHEYTILSIAELESDAEITMTDMCGKVVRTFAARKGNNEILIEKGNLPAGMYLIRLSNGETSIVEKISFQ